MISSGQEMYERYAKLLGEQVQATVAGWHALPRRLQIVWENLAEEYVSD